MGGLWNGPNFGSQLELGTYDVTSLLFKRSPIPGDYWCKVVFKMSQTLISVGQPIKSGHVYKIVIGKKTFLQLDACSFLANWLLSQVNRVCFNPKKIQLDWVNNKFRRVIQQTIWHLWYSRCQYVSLLWHLHWLIGFTWRETQSTCGITRQRRQWFHFAWTSIVWLGIQPKIVYIDLIVGICGEVAQSLIGRVRIKCCF